MSRALTIFCACALAFALVVAEEEVPVEEPIQGNENGFSLLVARRTFLNDSFVEGREMSVRIDIWNLGTKYVASALFIPPSCCSSFTGCLSSFTGRLRMSSSRKLILRTCSALLKRRSSIRFLRL